MGRTWRAERAHEVMSSGKRNETPPPKTSAPVKREAGEALKGSPSPRERSLAGSVERHIEPRKPPKK
jgi:hypothetical protein